MRVQLSSGDRDYSRRGSPRLMLSTASGEVVVDTRDSGTKANSTTLDGGDMSTDTGRCVALAEVSLSRGGYRRNDDVQQYGRWWFNGTTIWGSSDPNKWLNQPPILWKVMPVCRQHRDAVVGGPPAQGA